MIRGTSIGALMLLLALAPVSRADPSRSVGHELIVEGDRVTLRATQGSIVQIVEQLGRHFDFEVFAHLSQEAPVTMEFEALPLDKAIRRICASVGYVVVPDPETELPTKLVLTPGGTQGANRMEERREPFRPRSEPSMDQVAIPEPPATDASGAERAGGRNARDRSRRSLDTAGRDRSSSRGSTSSARPSGHDRSGSRDRDDD